MFLTDTEQAVYHAELYDLALDALERSNISERNAYILLDHFEYDIPKVQLAKENEVSKTRAAQIIANVEARMLKQLRILGVK